MDRFKKIYQQGTIDVVEIWVDTQTGVNYVFHRNGNAAGFTPLLDKALEMGVVLTVISVDIKPVPGQMYTPGEVSTCLESNDLIQSVSGLLFPHLTMQQSHPE